MQPASQLGALACCLTALTTAAAAAVADRAVARRGREVWQCTLSQCKQRWPVRSRCQALCSSSSSCMGSIWQRCRVMIVWRDALVVWGHTLPWLTHLTVDACTHVWVGGAACTRCLCTCCTSTTHTVSRLSMQQHVPCRLSAASCYFAVWRCQALLLLRVGTYAIAPVSLPFWAVRHASR